MTTGSSADPATLCRLDDALIERIRRGEQLGPLVLASVVTIAIGAGSYGAAFGLWRAPEQALYTAIKLPLLIFGVVVATLGLNAILATLLRADLSMRQSAVCVSLSLAITSAILGALAPISMFLVASAPPPDPLVVGLSIDDPRVEPSMRVARAILLWHVAVVACAGLVGVIRLRRLLARLIADPTVARRVLVSWLAAQALVGGELSWLFRPFLGKPHLAPSFLRAEALDGNFVEEVGTLLASAFGPAGPWLALPAALLAIAWLGAILRAPARTAALEIEANGLVLVHAGGREHLAFDELHRVHAEGPEVLIERILRGSLAREEWRAPCVSPDVARGLAERIEHARASAREGPFRTSST